MTNPQWDPAVYAQYGDERALPFFDLVAWVGADDPRTVFDLGCGPGTQTVQLAERWPEASILGIDLSPEMIDAACALGGSAQTGGMDGVPGSGNFGEPSHAQMRMLANAWETTYLHGLQGENPVLDWTRGAAPDF